MCCISSDDGVMSRRLKTEIVNTTDWPTWLGLTREYMMCDGCAVDWNAVRACSAAEHDKWHRANVTEHLKNCCADGDFV